jgi:hypothetical protein
MKVPNDHTPISSLLDLTYNFESAPMDVLRTGLECAEILGDGKMACSAMKYLLERSAMTEPGLLDVLASKQLYYCVHALCDVPMVRVINLQRRNDRLDAFRSQILRENLFSILAVPTNAFDPHDAPSQVEGFMYDGYAIDGGGRKAEVHERITLLLGGPSRLQSIVCGKWCPNDLKPFDKDAPSDEGLVKMSDSEIACALSHIASWSGALRTFCRWSIIDSDATPSIFRHPHRLMRRLQLGGFATGDALLPINSNMEPSSVCVILEDDALFVERFRERLAEVLLELPRDFHFCSIGYGRPKSAPILPYGKYVGIPSHLFYMTGYLVSESGCRYLLDSLPVTGPIDAWMGLKMTQNWDNSFGIALGVGSHSRPTTGAVPSRKELGQILQFGAYCALTPLCSQRVGNSQSSSTGFDRRSWRRRDTDIVYSGDSASRIAQGQ